MKAGPKADWINQTIALTQWDPSHTTQLEQFSLLTVHSLLIDNDPQFKELKAIVQNYNSQVRKALQNRNPVNHASLRSKYVASLYKMLCQMCLMTNQQTQKKCLRDVYKWSKEYEFEKKERPITATTRATRPTTAKTRPTSGISIVVPVGLNPARLRYDRHTVTQIEQLNRQINDPGYENMLQEVKDNTLMNQRGTMESIKENQDYKKGSRTIHSQYQVPNSRLKQYKRKRIDLEDQPIPPPKTIKKEEKKKQEPKKEPPKIQVIPQPQIKSGEPGQQVPAEGEPQGEQAKPGEDDGPGLGDQQDIPLEGLQGGQGGQGGQELQAIDLQQPVDKLGPRIKVYTHKHVKQQHQGLISQANRVRNRTNKQLIQRRQQFEFVEFQEGWAHAKSKWQKQENRRREASKMDARIRARSHYNKNQAGVVDLSNPGLISDQTKPIPNKFLKLQETIDATLISAIKHHNISNIKYAPTGEFQGVKQISMSQRAKALSSHATSVNKPKQFTQILLAAQNRVQKQMNNEIQGIKERLTKHKVVCQLNTIQKACGFRPQNQQYAFSSITGQGLGHNKFFKVAKKKKKKKKK